ncbi:SDR family oxidoreductase [Planktotalea arctica]|uniref:SDR family oxidoreductase n=1 Tax=Planktotalea arctica TaxID=1481893 RepID=UPI003219C194
MSRPVLLITGASAGIGAACARLAAERYDIALNYRSDQAGAEAVKADCETQGARVILCRADVSKPEDITAMFAQIDAEFAGLDALINNAGIVGQTARVTDLSYARMREMFDVNVIGAILVAKEAVLRMQARSKGAIVNISSAAARLGSANTYVDYAASKAAIETFSKGLSDEVCAQGIRVNALRPGIIETGIHAKGGDPDRAARFASSVPMQRTGSPEEVAKGVLWLLSDEASYVTGTVLDVTGGR